VRKRIASAAVVATALMSRGVCGDAVRVQVTDAPLAEVLRDIQRRSGVEFSCAPELADDAISQTVSAGTWEGAIPSLLTGYNYAASWNAQRRLQKVIISGRSGSAKNVMHAKPRAPRGELLAYEPMPAELPEKYRNRHAGSTFGVTIPVRELGSMEPGERIHLTLPVGQFEVVHDQRFEHENGDVTWVGHLSGKGRDYRVIVTSGADGSVGQVATPGGVYSLDWENGRNWLSDLSASSFRPGSSEQEVN
jgi:hypothetical protein